MKLIEKFKNNPKNVYYLVAAILFILINVVGLILYQAKNNNPETIIVETIVEPSVTPTDGPEPTDFPTPTADPTPTLKPTIRPTATVTPSPTNTPTSTPTNTPDPTATPTGAPANTPVPTETTPVPTSAETI
ncbi:MAG: hypothetical protein US68_C0013G0001 [Candidatus Shapirobacteria bacterium GW2011_GWE1_38_10]|uniref:Uncharacterized protein n=1 Tax=Candidatus Shapirobacteria bacterium GW2011_GWE1_38_10 TaxID=1618488 RepID=A0A0G0LA73_9BACT|nr:MAG: hypothetical protein US46_C0010G0036 [Candidatus Shapirobacteria bacterium GW2011_GWF2_37_20]KKQ49561.1 MAG: hypothetical protein US68_C0013G0001 [Candidatus Shapirobacteria bacterium GW2011_GWE1_38_10]KKQ62991.1 MAG: hypothetical protein US85_C0020G0004 [Candidatus Shapirobacteria bacterium GW2011_GWF1_38_23]HBP51298.1 hypothetical protein [Candidatus Shapirobacteria bacterium]